MKKNVQTKKIIKSYGILVFTIFQLLLSIYSPVIAQGDKMTIGITPFTGVNHNGASLLTDQVAACFASKSRFIVVDRSKMKQLSDEKDRQKSGDFINGQVVEQGKSVGAQYIIAGNLGSLTTTAIQLSSTNYTTKQVTYYTNYQGNLNLSLSVIDVVTGQTKSSKSISVQAGKQTMLIGWTGLSATEEGARSAVINACSGQVLAWINEVFPSPIVIAEIQEKDKNGLPTKVLITAGTEMNLQDGSKLSVVEHDTLMVNGSPMARDQIIGEVKVKKVENGNFSDCKVTDGAAKIMAAMDAKKSLELKIIKY